MGGDRKLLGRWGESVVGEYLRKQGYRLVAASWQCRFGEIDLIAENREYLVFVEVKLRKNADHGEAREFVTPSKQRKVRTAASLYLAQHPTELQPRFDVAEVYAPQGMATALPQIHYLANAF